jgi:hypothetical protein
MRLQGGHYPVPARQPAGILRNGRVNDCEGWLRVQSGERAATRSREVEEMNLLDVGGPLSAGAVVNSGTETAISQGV